MEKTKSLIRHIAPTLATALNGPFAGVATKFMSDHLHSDNQGEGSVSEGRIDKMLNDPGNLQKVKEIDHQFESEMKQIGVDVFAIEKAEKKESGRKTESVYTPQIIISVLFLLAYFLMLATIFFVEVSDKYNMLKGENSLLGELQILFGVLTAGVAQILSYWFGGVLKKNG